VARGILRRLVIASLGVGVALLVAACASREEKEPALPVVRITERDFRIAATPRVLHAGKVEFAVLNKGPVAHELLVLHTASNKLPLRTDGLTVDEDAIERSTLGVLEPGQPGKTRTLRLKLPPGDYELICNMSGHYLGGMHTRLVVR
jgi:uncharacterized cupredoxin-like copper-binding protein